MNYCADKLRVTQSIIIIDCSTSSGSYILDRFTLKILKHINHDDYSIYSENIISTDLAIIEHHTNVTFELEARGL